MFRIIITALLSFFVCSSASAGKVGCEHLAPSQLTYLAYGIKTPPKNSGWVCEAFRLGERAGLSLSFSFRWSQGNKKLYLSESERSNEATELSSNDMASDSSSERPYAIKNVRYWFDAFLGDETFKSKGMSYADEARNALAKPTAIFFSKNNEHIAIYTDEGTYEHKGKVVTNLAVHIYKQKNEKKSLNVECSGCTPGEFFSLVVNPALQGPTAISQKKKHAELLAPLQ